MIVSGNRDRRAGTRANGLGAAYNRGDLTAILASNLAFEFLSLLALQKHTVLDLAG